MALIISPFAITLVPVAVVFLVVRNVHLVVPVVLNEVDRLAAGVVLAAMLAPVFLVPRRHMQIDWLSYHLDPLDHNRLRKDQSRRRSVADVDATIEARLADADRNADVGSERRDGDGGQGHREQNA